MYNLEMQERLNIIDKLSNTLAPESEMNTSERGKAAYLIHEICNGRELSSDTYREIVAFQIASKRSVFVTT